MQEIVAEIRAALSAWRFWTLFGFHDAQAPLSRTRFGLLFYTLQSVLRVTVIFIVLGPSVASGASDYFGYLAIGIPLFTLYSAAVTSGYGILSRNKALIENGNVSYLSCILRFMVDHTVRFSFAALAYVGFLIFHPSVLSATTLLVIPGIIVAFIFVFAVALAFMVVSAFFPDISEAVNAVMAILFFATPVIWHVGDRGGLRHLLALANPFSHMIAIVREPALGHRPEIISYIYACSVTLVILIVCTWLFATTRKWMIFKL